MTPRRILVALAFTLPTAWAQVAQYPAPAERSRPEEMQRLLGTQPAVADDPARSALARREMRRLVGTQPDEAQLLSHRHYQARDGHEVHAPARSTHDQVPAGASAKCRDSTYSFSQHRSGTCSHHGGVADWL